MADVGIHGGELWESDWTAAGTVIVQDIWTGACSSRPRVLLDIPG
jgi:ELWxxDGT repeat protein